MTFFIQTTLARQSTRQCTLYYYGYVVCRYAFCLRLFFFFFVFALATSLCLFVAVLYVYICRSFLCSIVCCVCWPFPHTFCMKFFHRLRRQSESSVGLPKKRSIRLAVWRSQLTDNLPLPSNVPELLKAIALEVARTHTYKQQHKQAVGWFGVSWRCRHICLLRGRYASEVSVHFPCCHLTHIHTCHRYECNSSAGHSFQPF